LASGVGLIDPASDRAILDAADASPPQPAAHTAVVRSQGAAPTEPVNTVVAQLAVVAPSQGSAGSTNPGIPEFARAFFDRSELDSNSDTFEQPLVTVAWPTSTGGAVEAPPRPALRTSEDHARAAVPNLVADVQIAETGNNVPSGLPSAASSPPAASNVFPADLSAQLFHQVMGSVSNGGQEVVLQLHPPDLGDLTVRVLVHGREVSAWFATPQIQVQQAISQAIG
jgi:hypothetical protein